MTIAVCYVSPEGIVLGADSTSSHTHTDGYHFLDFTQKIFEIGENSTLGLLVWGMGAIGSASYRTLLAQLADDFAKNPPVSVNDVATRWADQLWPIYDALPDRTKALALAQKPAYDPTSPDPSQRTKDEESELLGYEHGYYVGFCIAGHVLPSRDPIAAVLAFTVTGAKPVPTMLSPERWNWWGVPNAMSRLMKGFDNNLRQDLLNSGHWKGTEADLDTVLAQQEYIHASLPIRDAIDWVHSSIHSTIKALKFSTLPQVCGGPIEIAVITTDRRFRWVRHKSWDAAISEGAM